MLLRLRRLLIHGDLLPQVPGFRLELAVILCISLSLAGCNRSGETGPPAPQITLADVNQQIQAVKASKTLRSDQKFTLLRNLESEKPLLGGTMDPAYAAKPKPSATGPNSGSQSMEKFILPVVPTPAP